MAKMDWEGANRRDKMRGVKPAGKPGVTIDYDARRKELREHAAKMKRERIQKQIASLNQ